LIYANTAWPGILPCAVALGLIFATPLAAQDTPRDVRMKAQTALSQGAYADAIGYLQQLIEWFGDSKKDVTITQMESVYFSLGTCNFFLGQFSEAREVFATYLKKYRTGMHSQEAALYSADCHRFEEHLGEALKAYADILKKYELVPDLKADVYMSMARCYLAQDKWDKAVPLLRLLYSTAPDFGRRNWAASLLTTAYLKEMHVDKVYRLIPYLLVPNTFASRSVALNMAALEAGDDLFADEKYRDALWVYRLVYPHDVLTARSQQYLEFLQKQAERLKRTPDNPRFLMRVQEQIGELEGELKALASIENYDMELFFRMARAYMEIRRFREACDLFLYLHDIAGEPRANEALFFAFQCAARLQPWDRAIKIGMDYMDKYPAGEYYDDVSIMVGQIYSKLEDWPNVIAVLTKALEVSPQHKQAAECMFLIGYASFMEEKFEDAVTWLRKMNTAFPGNPREADGLYWIGMGLMFQQKFDEAIPSFDDIPRKYPNSTYVVDAEFRRAVCDFGASRFQDAEQRLKGFVVHYPTNKLSGEAYMMLGDTAASRGDLPHAVAHYQQVPRYDVNIEFYNYAAFRAGEMLSEMRNYKMVISHFKDYTDRNREGSNLPLAMYWTGMAMWNMGEQRGALEHFRKGVAKYGVDRKALGIDLILEEWVGQTRSAPKDIAAAAWKDLEDMMKTAERENQTALALRLRRVLTFQPGIADERKQELTDGIMAAGNITNASPGVLDMMLDVAKNRGDTNLAVAVAEATIRDFTETDHALSSRMFLAQVALTRNDYKTAIKHLLVVKEVFASSSEAAEALLMLGDIYVKTGKYPEADDCYKSILAVREWRGPLWPAALYGRADCARLQRNFEQAAAYFERIYVMYGGSRKWSAKAYLARSECLAKLGQYKKAAETLEELVANQDLQDQTDVVAEARKKLEDLKTKGI
jgi:TolA-binding protein